MEELELIPDFSFQNNLKRSREDGKTIMNGTRNDSNGIERGELLNQQQQRSTANHTISNKNFTDELYIEDVKLANGDCDKELVSPPAKVSSKTVAAGDVQPINLNGNKLEDAELAESEYSSLDDEEADDDDDFDEDGGGAAGGTEELLLEEDVFDAMTAEDSLANGKESSLSENNGKKELPGSVSGCVRGGTSSSASVPFSPSLFPNVPLYFSFSTHTEAGPTLPACITKVMKWKVTPVTPVVVRKVLVNTGFRLLKREFAFVI